MEQLRVLFDRAGNTLTVWFGDPHQEQVCEETADEVVLMKDAAGSVIGFEKLNFLQDGREPTAVVFETIG